MSWRNRHHLRTPETFRQENAEKLAMWVRPAPPGGIEHSTPQGGSSLDSSKKTKLKNIRNNFQTARQNDTLMYYDVCWRNLHQHFYANLLHRDK